MARLISTAGVALGAVALAASCSGPIDGLTDEERAFVHRMQLPEVPTPDLSNAVRNDGGAITLGQALFFDPDISGPMAPQGMQQTRVGDGGTEAGQLSCADCHAPSAYFSDVRSSPNNISLGAGLTTRNSPPLVNVGYYQQVTLGTSWFAWDGASDSLWMQCALAYQSPKAMGGGSGLRLARALHDKYLTDFEKVFPDAGAGSNCYDPDAGQGDPSCKATLERLIADSSKAIAAYLNTLVTVDSPFDRFAGGDESALTDQQLRGLKLFLGQAGCITCHSGPGFTDGKFHNTGVAQAGNVPDIDIGREGVFTTGKLWGDLNLLGTYSDLPATLKMSLAGEGYPGGPVPADVGSFRTKSLRDVAQTDPYMHAGQKQTLADVVNFYNVGGDPGGFQGTKDVLMQPLGLSSDDISDLVSFLQSLTGSPVVGCMACDNSCGPYEAYPAGFARTSLPRCAATCSWPTGCSP